MGRKKASGAPTVTSRHIAYCLKNLHDGTALRQSPLVELPAVTRLAAERYRGTYWGHANALRDVIVDACARLEAGMDGDRRVRRTVTFLKLYASETTITEIARVLAVDRTTIYRFVFPDACALLADEMQRDTVARATRAAAGLHQV